MHFIGIEGISLDLYFRKGCKLWPVLIATEVFKNPFELLICWNQALFAFPVIGAAAGITLAAAAIETGLAKTIAQLALAFRTIAGALIRSATPAKKDG